ncbi:hypothetical protein P7C70_g5132, partial [Phenoliferia sp. Uapishka_3]
MFAIPSRKARTVDVKGSTVVARYTSNIIVYDCYPTDSGPYNACISTNPQATVCYGFEAPKLAALLTTFANVWRPRLNKLTAPTMEISSPESLAEATELLERSCACPQDWTAFKADVLRHRYNITLRVQEMEGRVRCRFALECAMIRRLSNEVLSVEESWTRLSDAILAYEQENPKPSYFKKARTWFSGFVTKTPAPPTTATPVDISPLAPSAHRSVSSSSTSSSNSSRTSDSSRFANSSSNFADAYEEELYTELPSGNLSEELRVSNTAAKASFTISTIPTPDFANADDCAEEGTSIVKPRGIITGLPVATSSADSTSSINHRSPSPIRLSPVEPLTLKSPALTAMHTSARPSSQPLSEYSAVGSPSSLLSTLPEPPKLSLEMRFWKALFPHLGNMSSADSAAQNEYNIMHNSGE